MDDSRGASGPRSVRVQSCRPLNAAVWPLAPDVMPRAGPVTASEFQGVYYRDGAANPGDLIHAKQSSARFSDPRNGL